MIGARLENSRARLPSFVYYIFFNIKELSFLSNVWCRNAVFHRERYYIILKLKIKQPATIVIFLADIKKANMYNYYVSALYILTSYSKEPFRVNRSVKTLLRG